MLRPILFTILCMVVSSCNDDHSEEIAECQQCDTLINLKGYFEDPTARADGDTVIFVLQKAPDYLPITRSIILRNGQKEFLINDTIHMSDSISITHRGNSHVYYGFKKDWYVTANMFDHNAGFCGLHDYFIDGTEIHAPGTVLVIPK